MGRRTITILALLAVVGCSDPPAPVAATRPAALPGLPVRFTAGQRTTTPVPGSDGRLLVTVDDVTRGQVMVTVAGGGRVLVPTRSMKAGDTTPFTFDDQPVVLRVERLDNALIGTDAVVLEITASDQAQLSEREKIERLITGVGALAGAAFVRNGGEHSAAAAADHLRSKWAAAGEKISTARQFVDHVASKSSMSGEPYRIRLVDGKIVDAGEYFNERLRQIEQGR